jgi:hypothetical protein
MRFRNLVVVFSVLCSTLASSAKADDLAKPIDLSLPQPSASNRPRAHRLGLHGGAAELLRSTKPVDPVVDDATREGKVKRDSQTTLLYGLSPADHTPTYGATSPNLPGAPNVISP